MKYSILSTVKNALTFYVDLTIKAPIKEISSHSALSHRSPKEAEHFSLRKNIINHLEHRSPNSKFSFTPHNLVSHYVGDLDTAAKNFVRGKYVH